MKDSPGTYVASKWRRNESEGRTRLAIDSLERIPAVNPVPSEDSLTGFISGEKIIRDGRLTVRKLWLTLRCM